MKMRLKAKLRIFMLAAFVLCAVSGMGLTAAAASTVSVNMTGTYGQSEARSMLSLINGFRTGSDAWYWNEDNTTKTVCTPLTGLTYDYNLEKAAMQRAMEIALSFSHTRPNGTSCFTVYSGYTAAGENIAAGYSYTTAESVFAAWQETNKNYDGQGHRRNMLSSYFRAVGIGHVYFNGVHYWVQEFGSPVRNTTVVAANDSETTVAVDVLTSGIINVSAVPDKTALTVPFGQTADLPVLTTRLTMQESFRSAPVSVSYTWSTKDSSIASVSSGKIKGNKCGTTELTTTILGTTVTVPVTVEPVSINSAAVILAQDSFTYDGTAKTPAVQSVALDGGAFLIEGTDYTVSYSNNTNAGTASVTVTGTGNYGGSVTKYFTIHGVDFSEAVIDAVADQTYTGVAITPAVRVTFQSRVLNAGTDYTVSYSNNVNAGSVAVTVAGKNNYTGTLSGSFRILPRSLEQCTVDAISNQIYTGAELRPGLTIRFGTRVLAAGTDYTAEYSNNISVGTASVKISGKGNYTGSIDKTFVIVQKQADTPGTGTSGTDGGTNNTGGGDSTGGTNNTGGGNSTGGTNNTGSGNSAGGTNNTGSGNSAGGTNNAGISNGSSALTAGKSVEDSKTKAVYKVTSFSVKGVPYVEYVRTLKPNAAAVVIPDTVVLNGVTCRVTSIGAKAFLNNQKVKRVTIGKYVTAIGQKAFSGCTALTKITIPAKVTQIGKKAFYGCKKLKSVTIKTKKLTSASVGSKAFKGIYSKAAVKVPSSKLKAYKKLLKTKGIGSGAKITK